MGTRFRGRWRGGGQDLTGGGPRANASPSLEMALVPKPGSPTPVGPFLRPMRRNPHQVPNLMPSPAPGVLPPQQCTHQQRAVGWIGVSRDFRARTLATEGASTASQGYRTRNVTRLGPNMTHDMREALDLGALSRLDLDGRVLQWSGADTLSLDQSATLDSRPPDTGQFARDTPTTPNGWSPTGYRRSRQVTSKILCHKLLPTSRRKVRRKSGIPPASAPAHVRSSGLRRRGARVGVGRRVRWPHGPSPALRRLPPRPASSMQRTIPMIPMRCAASTSVTLPVAGPCARWLACAAPYRTLTRSQ